MGAEKRLDGIEARVRRLQALMVACALLLCVAFLAGAQRLLEDVSVVGSLDVRAPGDNAPRTVLSPNGDVRVGGDLVVAGSISASDIALRTLAENVSRSASTQGVLVHTATVTNDRDNIITTRSRADVDVPNLQIPFERERDTPVLIHFFSGAIEPRVGTLFYFTVRYDGVPLRSKTLDEFYAYDGVDLLWSGVIPAGQRTINVSWRSATGKEIKLGTRQGERRRLVVIEFR